MKYLLLIFFLFQTGFALAQIKTNVNATGKHKYLMGEPKRTQAQIKARKQQLEAYQNYLEIKAMYGHQYDSTKVVYIDSIYVQKQYPVTYKTDSVWSGLPNDMRYDFKPTPDSMLVSQRVLASGNLPPEAARYLANPPQKPSVSQIKAQIQDYRNYMEIKKLYEEKYDSTKIVYIDSIYVKQKMNPAFKNDPEWSSLPENLRYPYAQQDSLIVSKRVLESDDFPPEAAYYLTNPPPNPKTMLLDQVDSTAYGEDTMKELLSVFAGDLPGQQQPSATAAFSPASNPNMLSESQAQAQMALTDPKEFAKQQVKNQVMKSKYASMPDQRYPEDAQKRNSLEDASMTSRIYFGGLLSIESTDPFILDFTLQVGYWLNRKWLAGVGMGFREKSGNDVSAISGDSWGNSLFSRYNLPKNFFAYAELQRQINESLFNKAQNAEAIIKPEWQEAYLLGVGREFKLGFVQMMVMLLYDFNFRDNDLYSRPFNTRIGFRLSKTPGLGKKE